jgi:transcriptional regulator with XRE-family HTH domain
VRAIREALGITTGKFAADVGIATSYLSNIESGSRQPSDAVVAAIAHRLGVPVDAIANTSESVEVA